MSTWQCRCVVMHMWCGAHGLRTHEPRGTALTGRSDERPELAATALPLEARLPVAPCRGGEALARRLFEPLSYDVTTSAIPLDERFPTWGDSRYIDLQLRGEVTVRDLLRHLYVLLPVIDDDKYYWVERGEIEKLLSKGGDWVGQHSDRDLITRRYLRHRSALTRVPDPHTVGAFAPNP